MRTKSFNNRIGALLFTGLLASSCTKWSAKIEGVGAITTHTLQIDDFTKIRAEGEDSSLSPYLPAIVRWISADRVSVRSL